MKFSSRQGLDPKHPKELVFEDAPEWLRSAYVSDVLTDLWYIDMDTRVRNEEGCPLGVKRLHEKFCATIRVETEETFYDSWYAGEELAGHLKSCKWYHFYDFVELVARELKTTEESHVFDTDWLERFGFENYRRKVNALFMQERIGWRLNGQGELVRELPAVLQKRVEAAEERLVDKYSPAREHYRKAHRFLVERPADAENSIKEIVSAVESVARVAFPRASTLGDALKEMRKTNEAPQLLISVVEKFYAFASAEPAVRHGAAVSSRIQLLDAELSFHIGIALILYVIEHRGEQQE